MHLSSLTLTHIRQFDRRTFEFQPGFNLLVGENGAGKTTILRSILAVLGGIQQDGRRAMLEDDDIQLRKRDAEVRAVIQSSNAGIEEFLFRKILWEPAIRALRPRNLLLVLLYASNEATCSAMRVKRAKRIRGIEGDDLRSSEEFLYRAERDFERRSAESGKRRFGNSHSVRDFVGRVLYTFDPDFSRFYWRFEPYDCALVPANGSETKSAPDMEMQKKSRAFAMRFFEEGGFRRDRRPFEWPDQAKVVLTSGYRERARGEEYLPDLDEMWKEMRISPELRKSLENCSLEVRLTPRIMIQRTIGPLSLSQLSDGEQRLFSLFVDIARRLSLQNPRDDIGRGEAIVLIDEIDVHLHPKWQRKIVPALEDLFRSCQFIATTHSPFVIQAVDRHKIQRTAGDSQVSLDETANSIEDIAEDIQGIPIPQRSQRAEDLSVAAERYFSLLKRQKKVSSQELNAAELEYRLASEPFTSDPALNALLKVEILEASYK